MAAPGATVRSGPELYVGLMTGTSLDGVDAVLADCSRLTPRVLAHEHRPLADSLKTQLLDLNAAGPNELHRAGMAALDLAAAYAECVQALLAAAGKSSSDVRAIGAHGQTVRHRPDLGYTVQLNAPARLAELTGIDVVADFRTRDLAAGGQGAPLVPAFHRLAFASGLPRAVVNIGGISNITAVGTPAELGFDAGPGNVLIDAWMDARFGAPCDVDGRLAATSAPDRVLLSAFQSDPYFTAPPPKSTGRDLFTLDWVMRNPRVQQVPPAVVLATLTALTAACIADAVERWLPEARDIVVCGGGAYNETLMQWLRTHSGGRDVTRSDAHGIPADQVEALAFAWLAQRHVQRKPGNLPSATGARGARILGALYPAG